jgi:hypothetical protein
VNRPAAEQYVSGFDFSQSRLDAAAQDQVRQSNVTELVVRGRLGVKEARFGTRPLLVLDVWRGLPGVRPHPGDFFYKASLRSPQIECRTAPCNNDTATRLGGSAVYFTRLSLASVSGPLLDRGWLADRVLSHGALVSANLRNGTHMAGGYEKVLDASEVYLHVPEAPGPSCPVARPAACPAGQVRAYARDVERCVLPDACVTRSACPMYVPHCDDGYVLQSWAGAPDACPDFFCDPAFSVP